MSQRLLDGVRPSAMVTIAERPATTDPSVGRWSRLALPAVTAATAVGALMYVRAVDPAQPGHYPGCWIYNSTGLLCPGCGMTRATHALMNGDPVTAMRDNALWVLMMFYLAYLGVRWTRARWRGTGLVWTPSPAFAPLVFVVVALFTVLRNLPGFEFIAPW